MVRIGRDIVEPERAVDTRRRLLAISADRIVDGNRSLGNRGAGRVNCCSFDSTRVAQRLTGQAVGQTEPKQTEGK